MSHITSIQLEIKDLEAVKALCKEKGWTFKEGQTRYEWYGRFVGDTPLPKDMKEEEIGLCDHAIGIPGAKYEIGLAKVGNGYKLRFDYFGPGGLVTHIGKNGNKFMQAYGVCAAEQQAKRLGLVARRMTGPNNAIKVVLTGSRL